MNLFWAALIVVLVAIAATTAMLLVRQRAPEGSYFEDGDRAAGVVGVLEQEIAGRSFEIPCDARGVPAD